MRTRIWTSTILGLNIAALALSGFAHAQTWATAYDSGLKAAKAGNWVEARKGFQLAKANRPDDLSNATSLPGPATEKRTWRSGSPYSPNFLAAYSTLRLALSGKADAATPLLNQAAGEFEALINKKQTSSEAVYFLNMIYSKLSQTDKRTALAKKVSETTWKVDTEIVAPDELAAMRSESTQSSGQGGIVQIIDAKDMNKGGSGTSNPTPKGLVTYVGKKYALIIANGDNKLAGGAIAHASADAQLIKETISTNGGYDPANIETVVNGTADQIKKTAAALASRMPNEGTLFLFFTGAGVNIDGRDWLAGVDTEVATDTSSMISKGELYQSFVSKGVNIFSFFQVNRPITNGRFFGSEDAKFGLVSQMQSTMPGDNIYSVFRGGRNVGIFADAMHQVMSDLHSNQIPIGEFGWQVFYKIRRGNSGDSGGGSRQTPTLPVLLLLASNARF
jgi:hypothetical protein